jgi:hypothetical protein
LPTTRLATENVGIRHLASLFPNCPLSEMLIWQRAITQHYFAWYICSITTISNYMTLKTQKHGTEKKGQTADIARTMRITEMG